jgi:tetratricopeptide (TPR) repeat protein/transcriptional regulator with XRE-family HTH domain
VEIMDAPAISDPPGAWLRRQRESAGLTQEELAERSGVSVRTIANLERDRTRRPYPNSLRSLVTALGLPAADGTELLVRYRTGDGHQVASATREPAISAPPTPASQNEAAHGDAGVTPRQLPAAPVFFTGRARELAALDKRLDEGTGTQAGGAVVISVIVGTAGVGKTTLALHWAHRVAARFPDGQLYANLRGYDPSGTPASPAETIRGFLDALHVHRESIPVDLQAQAGLYRSLVVGKQMLIVLDNASDAAQVRPLLPGSATCLVIVTSRSQLSGLVAADGARLLTLDVLTEAEARDLLTARLGADRTAAEPEAVRALTRRCARLPLALCVAAARAATFPQRSLAALVTELRDTRDRLDLLDAGEPATDVRAVFSWSYRILTGPAARMFRLLGLHPGPDISASAAASLASIPLPTARTALLELTRASLIFEHSPGRYTSHHLLHVYAAEQAQGIDTNSDRRAAIHRALDHYLHTANAACGLLDPQWEPVILDSPQHGVLSERLADPEEARGWFKVESPVLLAMITLAAGSGFTEHAWQLPWAFRTFLDWQGRWNEEDAVLRIALTSTRQCADNAGQARIDLGLGIASARLGHLQDAHAHLRCSLSLYQKIHDLPGQAYVHVCITVAFALEHRFHESLGHSRQALDLYRVADHRAGQVGALNNIGWIQAKLGEYEQALTCCRSALDLYRELGNGRGLAITWDSLGYAHHRLGDHLAAIGCYQKALNLSAEMGDRHYEAQSQACLGDAYHGMGDLNAARGAWQRAVSILDELHHRDANEIRGKLPDLGR